MAVGAEKDLSKLGERAEAAEAALAVERAALSAEKERAKEAL